MGKHIEILQAKEVRLENIEPNTGQIKGLPKNPRVIRDVKYKLLLKSIEEMPEMMSLRELLVFPAKLGGGGKVRDYWRKHEVQRAQGARVHYRTMQDTLTGYAC